MPEKVSGVLRRLSKGGGVLRNPSFSFKQQDNDVRIPANYFYKYGLEEGATIVGETKRGKHGPELVSIESISGLTPDEYRNRTPFKKLVAIDPTERFNLGASGDPTMRVVDLVAPIGRGTRGLIVSPPKAGKTMILQKIATAIREESADTRIIVLLIDERPEEVTHFRRSVDAEVYASSNDQDVKTHVGLAETTLAYIRTELECGRDIVLLVDSLTRMGRAFNLQGSGTRRTMSGGLEAGALETPRRFFGLARNIENGGSVTIIATALIDTGSRMDQLIFEEFKGTGNSEIVLSRELADKRIYPAIDLPASGTRKENLLYGDLENTRIAALRRVLTDRKPEEAMDGFLKLLIKYPTNEEFLSAGVADL